LVQNQFYFGLSKKRISNMVMS